MASVDQMLAALPARLRERVRIIEPAPTHVNAGKFVLYWMRTAVRVEENQALDVAIEIANQHQLTVLVYHALSERYRYASDRHHTFILEGARDVQRDIKRRGVRYGFHLEREGHRQAHLRQLAEQAAVVVTEEPFVDPLRRWTGALARSVTSTPVLAVDTACIVPARLVGQSYDRAFEFRRATQKMMQERLRNPYVDSVLERTETDVALPFESIDLQSADLANLVAACAIDHSVGPVPHTTGGSVAGYRRWRSFKKSGLRRYARQRNNPLLDGTSRMSAYLHYGMVAPTRIAREAAEEDSSGAEKYLDELLVWRELAHALCYYQSDHARLSVLPSWAVDTLADHAADRRPALLSWETLVRGKTGDALWDAAQTSLLRHGELHNNVRMTWGKALLNWTSDARRALATIIDLNHRYALDGRDAASFGGILWCLGKFDRPFLPEKPIVGTVRDRSTERHADRLNVAQYQAVTHRPLFPSKPKVAVLGAGISGLMCARILRDHGLDVTVLEKSRGVGGRTATRRAAHRLQFDHGAQYFTARDNQFQRYVQSWIHDGLVKRWPGRIVEIEHGQVVREKSQTARFVATPTMNSICKHLAQDVDVRLNTKVSRLEKAHDAWQLIGEEQRILGDFDFLIVSAPAGQTATLLGDVPSIQERAASVEMHPCWAVMMAMSHPLEVDFDGAFINQGPISWIARNSSKPDRPPQQETWVIHASGPWSTAHVDDEAEATFRTLHSAFCDTVGQEVSVSHHAAHRWRFALPPKPLKERCLFDRESRVVACGDWCGGPRVEGAFLSGVAAAGRILGLANQLDAPTIPLDQTQLELF